MNSYEILEYTKILEWLAEKAQSEAVKAKCREILPAKTAAEAERYILDTTQARYIIEQAGLPPVSAMSELERVLGEIEIGAMLSPEQILHVGDFLVACRRMKLYLRKVESTDIEIAFYGTSIHDLSELENEINRCIRNGQVDDRASSQLHALRRKIGSMGEQIKTKLEGLLRKNRAWFSEGYIVMRNGRYTLPVKREHKNQISGTLVEMSNTGGTCFIEPAPARKLQDELNALEIEEDAEIRRILYTLTAEIDEYVPLIKQNIQAMETLDFLFAKAKLSIEMQAFPVHVTEERDIRIFKGRHPLLKKEVAVPLDFAVGESFSGVIVTGPNTGGKTVALKTVGLLSLMAQSGLHVPADEQSNFCMHDYVLCDIGDGQSITENLSTFSSQITNILSILKQAGKRSLVLLDELGSGTDPAEGMGIAVAILEELRKTECLFAATTHYPEIKEYAAKTAGLVNARMSFDRESLKPMYQLEIGEAGESCALYIAERLGMPKNMLETAHRAAYKGYGVSKSEKKPERNVKMQQPADMNEEGNILKKITPKVFEKQEKEPVKEPRSKRFKIGDSVTVYPEKKIGIVYACADEKGMIGVQIQRKKQLISHKRLKLKVAAAELYPEDYDFSIVFDSVNNRRAKKIMEKRHEAGVAVVIEEGAE